MVASTAGNPRHSRPTRWRRDSRAIRPCPLAEDAEGASGSEPAAGSTGSSTGPCATSLSVPSWSGRSCLRATGACGSARREPASCNGRDGVYKRFTTKDGLPGDQVRALAEDRDGNLWVGTNQGLGRLTGGRWSHLGIAQGLSSNLVRAVFEDASGNLWIGFYGGGLSRLRDGEFTSLSAQDGLVQDLHLGHHRDLGRQPLGEHERGSQPSARRPLDRLPHAGRFARRHQAGPCSSTATGLCRSGRTVG